MTELTFKSVLARNNTTIRGDRAQRFANQARRDFTQIVNDKQKEIDNIDDALEDMMDISASNSTTSGNRIKGTSFDSMGFVKKRSELLVQKTLLVRELEVIKGDESFYSTNSDEKDE